MQLPFRRRGLRARLKRAFGLSTPQAAAGAGISTGVQSTAAYLAEKGIDGTAGVHSYGAPDVHPHPGARLVIGNFCSIAAGVNIWLGSNHHHEWVTSYPFLHLSHFWTGASKTPGDDPFSKGPITIGNDVWIGAGATIMSGVNIGDGAVIGAQAVVANDVPPYAVVVGNPGRVVKYRFAPDIIKRLLRLSWWDWPEEKINAALPLMLSDDIERFLLAFEDARTGKAAKVS